MSTSHSTHTHCSPLAPKKAKMEDTDAFKSADTLTFRIDNFLEFSKSLPVEASKRHCEVKVRVRGLTFGLAVYPVRCMAREDPTKMRMGIKVKCENASGCDVNGNRFWNCLASVTLGLKSVLKSRTDNICVFTHWFFSDKNEYSLDGIGPFRFDFLMDPKKGFYNEKDNTLELMRKSRMMLKKDAIQVNNEMVFVNKNILAAHSPYFHSIFYDGQFDEGQSGVCKVMIEAPASVWHFHRMIETMYPENMPLDDDCIEGVLHLANQFLMTDFEGKCLEFLMKKSTKPALFKYRLADKYSYTALKDRVLNNLKATDIKKKMFMVNFVECAQMLGTSALDDLWDRFDGLFNIKTDE